MRKIKPIFCAALMLLSATLVSADPAKKAGSIKGRVIDASNKPLKKFVIKLIKPEFRDAGGKSGSLFLQNEGGMFGGKVIKKATTDDNGAYKFADVPPGEYSIEGGNVREGLVSANFVVEESKELDLGDLKPEK